MSAPEPTLAEVIREALASSGKAMTTAAGLPDHIAAAVTAWASSDAAVERMARAMCEAQGLDWDAQADAMRSGGGSDQEQDGYRAMARAAVAALLGARTP
jgi:hypothetical protein